MVSPLFKRLPRDLVSDFGKYMVIFLLLSGTVGLVSGFLVADGSMIIAYNESFDKYKIEDGHFETKNKLNKAQKKDLTNLGIRIYDCFYLDRLLDGGSTMRFFAMRDQVNKACLMEGDFPRKKGEIAIDRMYADNNKLSVGDEIRSGKRSWRITGLVALSDYSALFSNNGDAMFDSILFGVGVVTPEEFATLPDKNMVWSYAFLYDNPPATEEEERDMADDLMEEVNKLVDLEAFIPRYENQAIRFTGEDMGSDRAMILILLYIIMAIMAFVFSITISDTIAREANVIGTLRASGYSRGELLIHYMSMPCLITLLGAILGNVLGYTVLKKFFADLYYGSYSLPTYETVWNGEAFVLTTLIPVVMVLVINFFTLKKKLSLSPLRFMKGDISGPGQKRALPLHKGIPFFARFRIRVILQNFSNYIMLFVGILFSALLLLFGIAMPAVLDSYQKEIKENMLSKYQYILTLPVSALNEDRKLEGFFDLAIFELSVRTDQEDAEKFSLWTLKSLEQGIYKSEDIACYGIDRDSKYIKASIPEDEALISSAYAEKYELKPGDSFSLREPYGDKCYDFKVAGIYNYQGALALFMNREDLNKKMDESDDYFCGYFSDTEISDIDERYIGSVVDEESLTKISRQLDRSMGEMMKLLDGFSVAIFLVVIYLLSKIIIEKNAQAISMAKILGYRQGEISRLYLFPTAIMVVISFLISIPLDYKILLILFRYMMIMEMTGWIPMHLPWIVYGKVFVIGILSYLAVAAFEYRKIRKVPMEEALKHVD